MAGLKVFFGPAFEHRLLAEYSDSQRLPRIFHQSCAKKHTERDVHELHTAVPHEMHHSAMKTKRKNAENQVISAFFSVLQDTIVTPVVSGLFLYMH
jgi:hypothetical protein